MRAWLPPGRAGAAGGHSETPAFRLTTQDGNSLALGDLKGKVLLVSFIFTTCNGSCPATTHRLGQVQQVLKEGGLLRGDRVRLLSITLDPVRDTPEVLGRYLKLYDVDPASWTFLTGPPDRVKQVIAAWGMWAKPAPGGQLDHPSRVLPGGPGRPGARNLQPQLPQDQVGHRGRQISAALTHDRGRPLSRYHQSSPLPPGCGAGMACGQPQPQPVSQRRMPTARLPSVQ